uniref:NADH dehydrogenase subunit 5 n=1 Tax=Periphykon beckeri TaxID=2006982 RepID=UPI0022FD4C1C|nr:NADH dehydrogenase subunit 5 [Periphykon beckeri]WAX04150.1 NADH dehydrogenase subunit 5 [Periphykon beckeri]
MCLTIIFLPLISAFSLGFFGRWIGVHGSKLISSFCMFTCLLFTVLLFFEVNLNGQTIYIDLSSWIISDKITILWNFLFDSLTTSMLMIVIFISLLVHLYSFDYMQFDPHFPRFIAFLGVFTFFMLVLVTSGNLAQLFLGWEGVGLASYLLINFWFTRLAANKAALKALIVNRIGDLGILFSILLTLQLFLGTLDFSIIFSLVPLFTTHKLFFFSYSIQYFSLISFFLIIGAIGKSAQLGLHTWLPDAMEGPTPVSALIHAATMVTAGVFLLIRFSPLLEFSPSMLNFLTLIGAFTAFFAAFVGIFQHDLKKVIAYSTCSQLGYMIFCCGLSCYNISLFHLFNHAFFKALLFLSAGSIIHATNNEQDMRRMGSFITFLPLTYSLMLIGSFALIGFPFLTGFYSKDVILEISNVFRNANLTIYLGIFACWLGTLAAFFTSFYSFRLLYLTFLNNFSNTRQFTKQLYESSFLTLIVLSILGICSIFIGYFFKEFFLGLGTDSWVHSLFFWPYFYYFLESEFIMLKFKWFPFIFTFLGFLFASILNLFSFKFLKNLKIFNFFFFIINKKWFFDFFYNKLFVYPLLTFGYLISYKNLDRGFIELIGPFGFSQLVTRLIGFINVLQTSQLTHYIFFSLFMLFLLAHFTFNFFGFSFILKLLLIFFIAIFYIV